MVMKKKAKIINCQSKLRKQQLQNWIDTFGKKIHIDKFCEGDYENENVQVPEYNNSSNKESDREVFDFLSSEDSCDEWLP